MQRSNLKGKIMRRFDLYVSRNFNGGDYFSSFEVDNINDFHEFLESYWHKSAITYETGEIFIFTEMNFNGENYNFQIGHYTLQENEIIALSHIPDEINDDPNCAIFNKLVGSMDFNHDEEKAFNELVNALILK